MAESDNIVYEENDIVIQYKADKHIKFFGDITEFNSNDSKYIRVKSDKYSNGIGTYIINSNFDNFNEINTLLTIIDGKLYIGGVGYVCTNDNTIIYPTDDTIAIVTEITILNGGINMGLFSYYADFVKKITVKSNNFSKIPDDWCLDYNSLEEVEIGEGVIEIGEHAFIQNPSLKHITLPASVESISYNIVNVASNVEITYLGTKNQWNNIHKSPQWNNSNSVTIIHCTDGDIEL